MKTTGVSDTNTPIELISIFNLLAFLQKNNYNEINLDCR